MERRVLHLREASGLTQKLFSLFLRSHGPNHAHRCGGQRGVEHQTKRLIPRRHKYCHTAGRVSAAFSVMSLIVSVTALFSSGLQGSSRSAAMEAGNVASTRAVGSYQTTLTLGGWLPIKTIRAVVTERPRVTVCGTPFGVKMSPKGRSSWDFGDRAGWRRTVGIPPRTAGLRRRWTGQSSLIGQTRTGEQ